MTRCEKLGLYVVEHNSTVRETAKVFEMSKSSVHNDLHKKLPKINTSLYLLVQKIMDENFSVRHIRGGLATKAKYLKKKG